MQPSFDEIKLHGNPLSVVGKGGIIRDDMEVEIFFSRKLALARCSLALGHMPDSIVLQTIELNKSDRIHPRSPLGNSRV